MPAPRVGKWLLKPLILLICLSPVGLLAWNALHGNLSANPISDVTNETGIWTLRFVTIGLAITPLRRLSGWNALGQFRRMIGLVAFTYVCLHFTTYILLDKFFDVPEMLKDVAKRPFITVGFTCFVLLIPLALTSTNGMMRRLGGRRWKSLHRLVYIVGIGGVLHYLWLVKADTSRPLTYGAVILLLLGYRIWIWWSSRVSRHPVRIDRGDEQGQKTGDLSPLKDRPGR